MIKIKCDTGNSDHCHFNSSLSQSSSVSSILLQHPCSLLFDFYLYNVFVPEQTVTIIILFWDLFDVLGYKVLGSKIALSWLPMWLKNFHCRPEFHNWSPAGGRLTTLFHAMIITQTIALIFSQIDQNKIQSHPPIGHFLFTFPLLWKYKTDFLLL